MSDEGVDVGKRRFLTTATAVVGAVGVGFAAVPFVRSWSPSARTKAIGAPVKVDTSKVEPGAQLTVLWHKQPVWVIHRTSKMLADLDTPEHDKILRDPHNKEPQQPSYCQNPARAIKPEYLVMIGICTHLGCIPDYHPKAKEGILDFPGFLCPCHGSEYDISGRVYKDVPAPLNMVVPSYHYEGSVVVIGEDPKGDGKGKGAA